MLLEKCYSGCVPLPILGPLKLKRSDQSFSTQTIIKTPIVNHLLEDVITKKKFTTRSGEVVDILGETHRSQCVFLQQIIEDNHFKESLEVGFAFGISTVAICESIAKSNGKHIVFDPAEKTYWGGHGLDLVQQAGYSDTLDFREQVSAFGLAQLAIEGRKFDFAYVDTVKMFDGILVDFYFISMMLKIGGIVVFDDTNCPGIRKVMRFISQLDHFKVYDTHPKNRPEPVGKLSKMLSNWSRSSYLVKEEYTTTDASLGINSDCVAFQKIAEDTRNWDWHRPF